MYASINTAKNLIFADYEKKRHRIHKTDMYFFISVAKQIPSECNKVPWRRRHMELNPAIKGDSYIVSREICSEMTRSFLFISGMKSHKFSENVNCKRSHSKE